MLTFKLQQNGCQHVAPIEISVMIYKIKHCGEDLHANSVFFQVFHSAPRNRIEVTDTY